MDGWDNGAKLAQRPFEYSLSPPLTRVFFASSGHLVLWKLFSGGSYRGYPLRRHLCHLFNGFFFSSHNLPLMPQMAPPFCPAASPLKNTPV